MSELPVLEQTNLDTYRSVAKDFSRTRHTVWPSTMKYLQTINDVSQDNHRSKVLEVGCGNGKNIMPIYQNIEFEGTDLCDELLDICKERGLIVRKSDGCNLPYADNSFDHVFSIAVIHHLSTEDRRHAFIDEMIRVCANGGHIIFQVWATCSPAFEKSVIVEKCITDVDRYVIFKRTNLRDDEEPDKRYYHFFECDDFTSLVKHHVELEGDIRLEKDNWIFEGIVRK